MTYERNLGGQLRTSRFELAALTRGNQLTDFRPEPQEKLKSVLEGPRHGSRQHHYEPSYADAHSRYPTRRVQTPIFQWLLCCSSGSSSTP